MISALRLRSGLYNLTLLSHSYTVELRPIMRKFFLIGIIAVILIAVPLTVYIITSQKTTTQSGAAPSTILSFDIPTDGATVGTPITIPVNVDPGGGGSSPNQVSFIKLVIKYDGNFLTAGSTYFTASGVFAPNVLEGPSNSCDTNHQCTISATLSTGADPNSAVSSQTQVATLTFNPVAPTTTNTPTKLTFDSTSQVLSIASTDKPAENVLQRGQPGSLIIVGGTPTDTPTPATTTTTGGTSGTSGGTTTAPISCSTLTADNTTSATAPFTVLLTATGGSTAGNITTVSFNYGDGATQDITSGGGIGTNSISVQSSHIYANLGTFTATAVLTDDQGNTTKASSCSQTITVGAGTSPTPTPTATPTTVASAPTAAPTLPPTGPGNIFIGIGVVGAAITIIGLVAAFGI